MANRLRISLSRPSSRCTARLVSIGGSPTDWASIGRRARSRSIERVLLPANYPTLFGEGGDGDFRPRLWSDGQSACRNRQVFVPLHVCRHPSCRLPRRLNCAPGAGPVTCTVLDLARRSPSCLVRVDRSPLSSKPRSCSNCLSGARQPGRTLPQAQRQAATARPLEGRRPRTAATRSSTATKPTGQDQVRIAELEQLVGRQAYELEILKKASRLLTGPSTRNGRSS